MKKNLKRTLTAVVAGVMAVNCMALASVMQAGAAATKYEFEDGKQSAKNSVKDDDANASGGKYVFLENGGDEISVTVPTEKTGMYTIKVAYSAPYGNKIQNLYVNDVDQGQCSFSPTKEGRGNTPGHHRQRHQVQRPGSNRTGRQPDAVSVQRLRQAHHLRTAGDL